MTSVRVAPTRWSEWGTILVYLRIVLLWSINENTVVFHYLKWCKRLLHYMERLRYYVALLDLRGKYSAVVSIALSWESSTLNSINLWWNHIINLSYRHPILLKILFSWPIQATYSRLLKLFPPLLTADLSISGGFSPIHNPVPCSPILRLRVK